MKQRITTACAVGGITCAASCIKIISTGDECLVERLGKFHRSLGPGLHLIFPPFETISFQDTLREQVLEINPQECFTADNAPLTADAIVYMRITNMKDACYKVFNLRNAVMNLCLTHIREGVGRLTLEDSFSSRGELKRSLLTSLNQVCHEWGVEITRVEIQSLQPSPEIMRALESQISAERKKRATILTSEGEKTKLINEAEGRAASVLRSSEAEKQSIILASQAEAERQRLEAMGIQLALQTLARTIMKFDGDSKNPTSAADAMQGAIEFLGMVRHLETQSKFSQAEGAKYLILPTSHEGLNGLKQKFLN
eukprot:CAMPEP_0197247482 /NCGR_PEP_ID=MMETSP1429-20130617/29221_1 /TAXON_ID=49237 /ORGANISM="Chaetoceros  sp., Strain UNC1202" /LENGTH=311 /DNA_ID=CAMNT_0042708397 /DNA_START=98 /DNA_END=1030 /DNA_ORIENTATION=-